MGVELTPSGYNLFVCGLSGTSRGGMIVRMIEECIRKRTRSRSLLREQFQERRPPAPAHPAARPSQCLQEGSRLGHRFPAPAHSAGFRGRTLSAAEDRIVERFTVREKELMDDFTRRIAREQFALGRMQVGAVALPEIFPVLDGQMVPIEEIPKMVQDGKLETAAAEELERKYDVSARNLRSSTGRRFRFRANSPAK
jgi:hypothetical protein